MSPTDHTRGSDGTGVLDRRSYLKATGAAATIGLVGLAGCTSGSTETGLLSTAVSDQPGPGDISDFDECIITIEGIRLSEAASLSGDSPLTNETNTTVGTEQNETDGEDDDEEDETYYEFEEPATANLVNLQGDAQSLVDEDREVPEGEYSYLKLVVTNVEGTVDGETVNVDTPGNAPIKFNQSFEIRSGWRTSFTADMVPVQTGNQNRYIIQPVASEVTVSYEQIESGNGNETNTTQ